MKGIRDNHKAEIQGISFFLRLRVFFVTTANIAALGNKMLLSKIIGII